MPNLNYSVAYFILNNSKHLLWESKLELTLGAIFFCCPAKLPLQRATQISQSWYAQAAHDYFYTNTQYLQPVLTAGAAHLPGDQVLRGGGGGWGAVATSWQEVAHSGPQQPRPCRGPAAAVLYLWMTAPCLTLTSFSGTPHRSWSREREHAECTLCLRIQPLCVCFVIT